MTKLKVGQIWRGTANSVRIVKLGTKYAQVNLRRGFRGRFQETITKIAKADLRNYRLACDVG